MHTMTYLIYINKADLSCALSDFSLSDSALHCFYRSKLKPEPALKLVLH